jgi:hypothetical protein
MTSDQQAEFARMRQYYQSQGERYSFAELWPRVSKARLELLDAFDGVTEDHANWAPGDGNWSIKEEHAPPCPGVVRRANRRFVRRRDTPRDDGDPA